MFLCVFSHACPSLIPRLPPRFYLTAVERSLGTRLYFPHNVLHSPIVNKYRHVALDKGFLPLLTCWKIGGDERHSSHRQRFRKHFRQHFSSFVNRLTCGLSRGITNAVTSTRRNEHDFHNVIETQPSYSTPEKILSELPFFGDNMSEFFSRRER